MLAHFIVRSVDQRRIFWLFMLQRNRFLDARQRKDVLFRVLRVLHMIL